MINNRGFVQPPIIHVAVADMDATYGAYVAVENTTVNDTNNSNPKRQMKNRFLVDRGKDSLFSLVLLQCEIVRNSAEQCKSSAVNHPKVENDDKLI